MIFLSWHKYIEQIHGFWKADKKRCEVQTWNFGQKLPSPRVVSEYIFFYPEPNRFGAEGKQIFKSGNTFSLVP